MSASPRIGDRAPRRRAAGRGPAAARSAGRTARTRAGAGRRRPPAGAAGRRWTGRAAPVGTGRSAARRARRASRYSTRSRARVRLSCAATAPGGRARARRPATGCPARRPRGRAGSSRSRSREPGQRLRRPRRAPPRRAGPRPARAAAAGRRRGAGCGGARSCSRHIEAIDVARRDDRVRLEHPGLDPVGGGQHPDQRLLHEVLGGGVVADPRADDPPDHRDQGGDVVAFVRARRRVGGRCRAHAREGARPGRLATPDRERGDDGFAHARRGRQVRMTGWSYAGEPAALGSAGVTLVEGSSFCVCDQSGDVREGTPHGVFFRDTRIISRWQVTLDGEPVETLAVLSQEPWRATFVGRGTPRPGRVESTLLLRRDRYVGQGMREDLTLENLAGEPAAVRVEVSCDADFADLFEVKESRVPSRRRPEVSTLDGALRLVRSYPGLGSRRGVVVSSDDAVRDGRRAVLRRRGPAAWPLEGLPAGRPDHRRPHPQPPLPDQPAAGRDRGRAARAGLAGQGAGDRDGPPGAGPDAAAQPGRSRRAAHLRPGAA